MKRRHVLAMLAAPLFITGVDLRDIVWEQFGAFNIGPIRYAVLYEDDGTEHDEDSGEGDNIIGVFTIA